MRILLCVLAASCVVTCSVKALLVGCSAVEIVTVAFCLFWLQDKILFSHPPFFPTTILSHLTFLSCSLTLPFCYWPMWPQEMSDVESGADRCIGKPGIPQLLAVKKDYIIDRVFCIAVLCMFLVLFIFIIFIL